MLTLSDKLRRLRDDLTFHAPLCLKIRAKDGQIVPFDFNPAQLHLHGRLEAQKERTGKVRALVLKGRQQGVSTYIGGRFYHRTSMHRGLRCFILTQEQAATDNLFGMVERYHQHNPIAPSTSAANAKELHFDILESGYAVGTAGTKAVGRSQTIQLFHGSEAAFWPNAATHFAGVVQAIPDLPGTEIILESTANGVGGEFHERWQQAESGVGDYEAIFIPWFWSPEYQRSVPQGFALNEEEAEYQATYSLTLEQMAWRRNKVAELKDPMLFKQEYPATAAEAFQMTGHDSFIKPGDVLRARKATIEGIGPLVIGVDPKREGNDRFSVAWRRGRQVSKVKSNPDPIDTLRAAAMLKDIIDTDHPDKMFIDVGGNGGAICDIMHSWGEPYASIVVTVNFGSAPIMPPKVDSAGKKMAGPKNRRAEMWDLSNDYLKSEGGADIPDEDSLQTDACGPGFHYDPTTAQLILESKEHMRLVRKVRSPDEWDAVALTFAEPVGERIRHETGYGNHRGAGGWLG